MAHVPHYFPHGSEIMIDNSREIELARESPQDRRDRCVPAREDVCGGQGEGRMWAVGASNFFPFLLLFALFSLPSCLHLSLEWN